MNPQQGDILYRDANGWAVLSPSAGQVIMSNGPGQNPTAVTPVATTDPRFNTSAESAYTQRIMMSPLSGGAGFTLLTGVAYFVYVGKTTIAITPKFVEFHVSTVGSGTQTAEVGIFSSPTAPSKAAQSLSSIVATSTVDSLTVGTGVKRNTSAFATSVPAGTHVWAGIRTALVTTQPVVWGIGMDMAQGNILSKAAAGALTAAGPWTGGIIAAATGVGCPELRITLD